MRNRINASIAVAIILVMACFSGYLGAQVNRARPTPDSWVDRYGTNFVILDQDATPGLLLGTTAYSGITTNINLTNACRLTIVKGLVVGTASNAP